MQLNPCLTVNCIMSLHLDPIDISTIISSVRNVSPFNSKYSQVMPLSCLFYLVRKLKTGPQIPRPQPQHPYQFHSKLPFQWGFFLIWSGKPDISSNCAQGYVDPRWWDGEASGRCVVAGYATAGFFQMAKSPHQVFSEAFVLSLSNFLVITRTSEGNNFLEKWW